MAIDSKPTESAHHELARLELLAEGRNGWVLPKVATPEGREVIESLRRRREVEHRVER